MDEVRIPIELSAIVISNCYPAADFPLQKEDVRVSCSQTKCTADWTTYHAMKAVMAVE